MFALHQFFWYLIFFDWVFWFWPVHLSSGQPHLSWNNFFFMPSSAHLRDLKDASGQVFLVLLKFKKIVVKIHFKWLQKCHLVEGTRFPKASRWLWGWDLGLSTKNGPWGNRKKKVGGCCRISSCARKTVTLHHCRSVPAPAFVLNYATKVWLRT